MSDRELMISIRHLRKEYENVTPLQDVNADIYKGDVISIIGPSGTGKSTLLRCINQLETPTSGSVYVGGVDIVDKSVDISQVRKKMGMVFQSFNLFANMSIIENIMFGPVELLSATKQDAYDEGMRLLESVGMAGKALSMPDELSGGQKQRVAIARALAMHPEIILFDEPTSALDPTIVGEVLSVIKMLAKQGMTMMIVTHEMKFARDVCNRVFYMDEGGIYEDGSPQQVFENPLREKTRNFVKRLRNFECRLENQEFDFIETTTALEDFCIKHFLPAIQVNNIQLVFEEICVQILLKRKDVFPIDFTFTLSELDNTCRIKIAYNGERFDPLSEMKADMSILMVSKICKEYNYTYKDDNLLEFEM